MIPILVSIELIVTATKSWQGLGILPMKTLIVWLQSYICSCKSSARSSLINLCSSAKILVALNSCQARVKSDSLWFKWLAAVFSKICRVKEKRKYYVKKTFTVKSLRIKKDFLKSISNDVSKILCFNICVFLFMLKIEFG